MIGIFGGTFDPVHYGHLRTLDYVQKSLSLDSIFLVPLGRAVHREQPVASAEQRFKMLLLAAAKQHDFIIDDREIRSDSPSYTVDTLESFREEIPQTSIALIVGSDAFNHFHEWHKTERILQLANLVIMFRPGHPISHTPAIQNLLETRGCDDKHGFIQSHAGKILPLEVPQVPISSTDVRHSVSHGNDISEMVPAPVERLIRLQGLYSD